jgi:hypothetical protein
MRASRALCGGVLACSALALGCDAVSSLFEPRWTPVDTNGEKGAFHFVTNPYDYRINLPEHVRVERTERRTVTKPGGAKEEQERQRSIQVVLARCRPASLCDAHPHSEDTREVVIQPRMIGDGTLEVTAAIDGKENMSDSLPIKVRP